MRVANKIDLDRFEEQGYLVVEGLFDPEHDLQPVRDEYEALLDALAEQWYAKGKLSSAYRELPFGARLTKIIGEGMGYNKYLDIMPSKSGDMHKGQAMFNLLRNEKLLDAIEQIVGPEIYCNPVQHVRIKPPENLVPEEFKGPNLTRSDWHQDQGVISEDADNTDMLTVWFPITQATVENGCLQVVPGSHKGELLIHCPADRAKNRTRAAIPDALVGQYIPLPMEPGDVLLMHKRTVHGSLSNLSSDIRWSFDLRYNPVGQPTGRDWLPGWVARSRSAPGSEMRDYGEWVALWDEACDQIVNNPTPEMSRWKDSANHELC